MDELDKLKGAWKSQDYSNHKVSSTDIYKMLHAKSSSYVKWIFYISIIEFVLINSLMLFRDIKKDMEFYDAMGVKGLFTAVSILSYIIIFYFIYLFYKNYVKIKVDANAKSLMERILKTRRTVKYYIYFNIGAMATTATILFYFIFSDESHIQLYKEISKVPADFNSNYLLISVVVVMIIFIGLFLLFYRIIYGILLRRLNKNHKELEQLDK